MKHTKKIAIIGAGVAGTTTALGLKKLGFNVTVFYKKRPFIAYEGISEKTKDGLTMLGCKNTSELLEVKSLRDSNWANQRSNANYEYVVNRDQFDKALLEDLKNSEIKIIEAKVLSVDYTKKPIIEYKEDNKTKELEADFIVDTRGRFTPYKKEYTTGPKSFSLLQELEFENTDGLKTSIDSIKDGWIWQAYIGENKGYLQFSCDEKIANKINSFEDILPYLKDQNIELWSLKNYIIKNKLVKRDAFCKIHQTIIDDKMILIGDAASSIDPLSGNGVFQALSMSSIAPYVINTILNKKDDKEIAKEFYKQRVNYIFEKFSNVGKEFYNLEKRFDSEFWRDRQNWPKDKNIEQKPYISDGAIVKDGFIHKKEVLITKDNPLGVFFFKNIEVIELAKYCLENSYEDSIIYLDSFVEKNDIDVELSMGLKQWLKSQKIL